MNSRHHSLRLRLLGGAVIWIAVTLVAVAVILFHLFRTYAETEFYADLTDDQDLLMSGLVVGTNGNLIASRLPFNPQFDRPYSGLYWQIDVPEHDLLLRSRSLWDFTLTAPDDTPGPAEQHRHRLVGPEGQSVLAVERLVKLPHYAGHIRVVVAEDASRLDAAIKAFAARLGISFLVLGLGLVAAAALQVWVGLHPLKGLRRRLLAVREGQENHLEGVFPNEVQPLVDDLNTLLDHQAEVVQRGRVMAGNLAHGLKTPLAVIANEVDQLAQDGGKAKASADQIMAQIAKMQRQVDYHMARARAAAARSVPGMRCELALCARSLARVVERLHDSRDLSVQSLIAEGLYFHGERQDLDEMLGNLMDNAAKWAASRVEVNARIENAKAVLTIDDDGPGLAEDQREEVFARGRRLDEAVPGSGLGLAIVRDLAELYGGSVHLEASPLGGLRAVLVLPGG